MMKMLPVWVVKCIISLGLVGMYTTYYKYCKMTSQELMDQLTSNKDLQAVLCYNFGDYGTAPREAPAMMQGTLVNHFMQSCSYPVGGASEVAFYIIPVIERYGGKVLVRAPVKKILFNEKGRACGVQVDKGSEPIEVKAKNIVSSAGIPVTMAMLPKEVAEKSSVFPLVKKKTVAPGVAGMNLFVGLRGSAKELGLERINLWCHQGNDLDRAFKNYLAQPVEDAVEARVPLLFISFPSTKDETWEERYPGKSVCTIVTLGNWEWFKNWEMEQVLHRGADYESLKDKLSKQMWSQVLELYPNLEDKVEYMSVGSPVTNNYYIGSKEGEIYGLDHTVNRFSPEASMALRPDIGVPGMLMSGQDVFTCGFSGGMAAGAMTVSVMLRRNIFDDVTKLKKQIKTDAGEKKTQ